MKNTVLIKTFQWTKTEKSLGNQTSKQMYKTLKMTKQYASDRPTLVCLLIERERMNERMNKLY